MTGDFQQHGLGFGPKPGDEPERPETLFPIDSGYRRSGSLFVAPDAVAAGDADLQTLAEPLIEALRPYKDDRALRLVSAVVELCNADPEHCTDMTTLTERLGRTRRTVLNILAVIEQTAVVEKHRVRLNDKQRSRDGYVFRAPPGDRQAPPYKATEGPTHEEYRPQSEASVVLDERSLDYPSPRGDQIAPFQLFSILPSRTGNEKTPSRVTRRIQIGRSIKDVEITSSGAVASVLDLRYLLALTNAFHDAMRLTTVDGEQGRHGVFLIEDLIRMMGRPNDGGNKRAFIASLERWYHTSFRITGWTEDAKRFFGTEFLDLDDYFRMLDNLQILRRPSPGGGPGVPVAVRVALNDKLYARMKHARFSMRVHREILREAHPKAVHHGLYYHARRAIKRNPDWTRWSVDHLRREINAEKPLHKFRDDIRQFLRAHCTNPGSPEPLARYNGYLYRGLEDDCLLIRAAPDDPIVGTGTLQGPTSEEEGGRVTSPDSIDLQDLDEYNV